MLSAWAQDAPQYSLAQDAPQYSLKLSTLFTPQSHTTGLLLRVRIDGGPVLRMLLDSGARHIVLDRHAAAMLGRKGGSPLDLVGFGAAPRSARFVAPGTLEIGDLVLRGCEMVAVDGPILEGIDGVVPMSLFSGFLVKLDVPGKTLELAPYPTEPPRDDSFAPARKDNNMLFLAGTVNESHPGYLLLDTGASFNALSTSAVRAWRDYRFLLPNISLVGGAGGTEGLLLPPGLRFRVGSRVLAADPAVAVDLSDLAMHHKFDIAGVVGMPALRGSVLTIDYRDSLVKVVRK